MADFYARGAEAWAQGMRAAESKTAARRQAAQAKAVANSAAGTKRLCGIKGCKRHTHKARLCRKHYDLVPLDEKLGTQIACWEAQLRAVAKAHRRYLPIAQALVDTAP